MTSAIAVLTFNRRLTLEALVQGLKVHCPQTPVFIFEDLSLRDDTVDWLTKQADGPGQLRHDLLATQYSLGPIQVFLATHNLGVAGNSNRALKVFMDETKADHLCLLNDDLLVEGDFVQAYLDAHRRLNIHLFCFCDFTGDSYRHVPIKVKTADGTDYTLKVLPRMTGIMMSLTRKLVENIGYFDIRFGKFGEEHSDYTNRARLAGAMRLQNQDLHCVDVDFQPPVLRHQEVESCISTYDKPVHDAVAADAIRRAAQLYSCTSWRRPFKLYWPRFAGAYESGGVDTDKIYNWPLVIDKRPTHLD